MDCARGNEVPFEMNVGADWNWQLGEAKPRIDGPGHSAEQGNSREPSHPKPDGRLAARSYNTGLSGKGPSVRSSGTLSVPILCSAASSFVRRLPPRSGPAECNAECHLLDVSPLTPLQATQFHRSDEKLALACVLQLTHLVRSGWIVD